LVDFLRSRIPTEFDHIIVDHTPVSEECDLIPRIRKGIAEASQRGYEYVFIAEDDDFYPTDFFNRISFNGDDFFGFSTTKYYNLANRTYQVFEHVDRSSLFCTGFRISALDRFNWPKDSFKWLDIKLWEYANHFGLKFNLFYENPVLGIKGHGVGMSAGKGHVMHMKHSDPGLHFLKDSVDQEAFEFYTELMKKI
jgi:hypothetical protein